MAAFRAKLAELDVFEPAALETCLKDFVEAQAIKMGDIVHAVRVAITGRGVGPGLYDCLAILGRDSTLKRIDRALAQVAAQS